MNTDLISRADAEALFRTARSKLNPSDYKTADEFNTRDLMLLNAEQMIHLLPSVTPQEPKTSNSENPNKCEDAISRQDAIAFMKKPLSAACAIEYLENAPSVTPKQRTGHWIECEDEVKCFCSECKEILDYPTKFCPNCGAKMVEQKESEEQE